MVTQLLISRGMPKATQAAARYTPAGGRERCGGCRHFMAPSVCNRILGPVTAAGWCRYFSQRPPHRAANFPGMGPPGMSLDLSFMQPGTLPTGVVFTRASTATYFDRNGVMQTAATNTPRWDYNPSTLALQGLLIEEARTNAILQSSNYASASWNQNTAITLVQGIAGAPDGTATFTRLVETATTNFHMIGQTIGVSASTTYTLSLFAKAAEDRYLQISLDDGGADGGYATFDLLAGTISQPMIARGAGVVGIASIQPIGGGIYRCSIVTSAGPGGSGRALIILSNSPTPPFAPSYAGNASNGLLIWGVQMETGTFPTSYVPTTTVAVARSADLASMSTGAWFNATHGTYQIEFTPNGLLGAQPQFVSGNAGSPTIGSDSGSQLSSAIRTVVQVFSNTGPLFTFGAVNKAAFGYVSGASMAAVNGGVFGPSATTFSVTGTVVELGSDGVTPGNNALDGWLRHVRYWPRVLTNAELQSVTT